MAQRDRPTECNALALRKAARRVTRHYDATLAPCGLRSTQYSILAHLERLGEPTVNGLAEAVVLDRSALGHNLRPLERDGLVEMRPHGADRRARILRLTETGRAALAAARTLWQRAQHDFETTFGAGEAAALRATLDRVAGLRLRRGAVE